MDVLRNSKSELLDFTETKVNGSEYKQCGVKCIYSNVERNERVKRVTFLICNLWQRSMVKFVFEF